ncbi:MAG: hypothetical protein WAU60_14670 [Candidatus Competibacter denitrificans]|jgi:hypothetical protein
MVLKAGRPTGRTMEHVDQMRKRLEASDPERRLNVRMPKSEYTALKRFALEQDVTISEVVRAALKKHMSQ